MALRMRKDVKKSSYYVWFLGAKESKGLRGKEFIIPIIDHLVLREKELEPHKVTLQVSHKGLKIIQNVLSTTKNSNKPKSEIVKHFLPHDTITCVYQDEDIVSVLLILYNPVTKCPLHCHVYRCDSVETASLLKKQLECLIERPENQKKYEELEARLKLKVEGKKKFESSLGSDTGISTRESTSSDEHVSPENQNNRIATLYDSLAAELRQKLNTKQTPILLPPRDYDTVHRQKGNLQNIDLRRCLNTSIVGQNAKNGRRLESSGGSSGIGSDHAPSPEGEEGFVLDNQSTSDDEWNAEQVDSSMYLMQNSSEMILPRASRNPENPEPPKSPEYYADNNRFRSYEEPAKMDKKEKYYAPPRYEEEQKFASRYQENGTKAIPRPRTKYMDEEIRYYEEDIKPQQQHYEEKTLSRKHRDEPPRYYPDFEDKYRKTLEKPMKGKYHEEYYVPEKEERYYGQEYYDEYPESRRSEEPPSSSRRHPKEEAPLRRYAEERHQKSSRSSQIPEEYFDEIQEMRRHDRRYEKISRSPDFFEDAETRRRPEERQRSPTPPEINVSPRDRFKDAKEKFLLMEKERLEEEERLRKEEIRRRQEMGHLSPKLKDKTFLKRHDSMAYPKNHYQDEEDRHFVVPELQNGRYQPKPAPRNIPYEEMRDRHPVSSNSEVIYRRREPLDRYRSPDKRRSMYSQIEEEHKTKSNEIARELKRRSYMENSYEREFQQIPQQVPQPQQHWDMQDHPSNMSRRYQNSQSPVSKRSSEKEYTKSNMEFEKLKNVKKYPASSGGGYRHSYAEPKMSHEKIGKKQMPEILHRTNSSVSNSGRVGIASVNPY